MKSLMLHACCAPCSTAVIESLLQNEETSVTVFFYNPNIHPASEYQRRKNEIKSYLDMIHISYRDLDDEWEWPLQAKDWFEKVKGVEWSPEKSRLRCEPCIELRLHRTAIEAKKEGFDSFATTLTISPHKDALQINRIGNYVSAAFGVEYIATNYADKGGFQRSLELSQTHNMYRQNYCGCVFSRLERKRYVKIKE